MKTIVSLGLFIALLMGGVSRSHAAESATPAATRNAVMAGGWTNYGPLSDGDQAVFNEALGQIVGVNYVPLLVKTQVVAGTNYEYYGIAKTVTPKATWYPVLVQLFKPLQGKAVVKQIIR